MKTIYNISYILKSQNSFLKSFPIKQVLSLRTLWCYKGSEFKKLLGVYLFSPKFLLVIFC